MMHVTDIEGATGANARFVDSLLSRQEMRTPYETTVRGRSRRFSLENALEIAFVHALVNAGIKPSSAVAYASSFNRQISAGHNLHEYLVLENGDEGGRSTNDFESVKGTLSETVPTVRVVALRAIKERVDNFFGKNSL